MKHLLSTKPQKAELSDKQGLDNTLKFESADLDTGEIIWSISLTGRHSAPVAISGRRDDRKQRSCRLPVLDRRLATGLVTCLYARTARTII